MVSPIDIAIVAAYLVMLVIFAAVSLRRRDMSHESVILAGRRLTLPAFVATLVSTWYGGILGIGEFTWLYGISNWFVFGIPYYLAAAIFAIFLARRARSGADMTIPDRLYTHYGPAATAAGSVIVILVTLPVAYVLMIGVLANIFFGIPIWLGIIAGTIFSAVYVASGGFRAVVWTDIVQFVLMFLGFAILLIVAVTSLGGIDYLRTNLPETHFTVTGGNSIWYILLWYIIALQTLIEPTFYQRCFAAKSVKTAQRGIAWSIGFWLIFDFLTTACGLYARALLPELANPVAAFPAMARMLLPAGLLGVFFLSLVATIMSTVDSYLFLNATTISHDIIWRVKKFTDDKMRWYTFIGLIIASTATIIIAIFFDSVVAVWYHFGSIGTSALLLPLWSTYHGRYRFSNQGATAAIILAPIVTGLGFLWPVLTGSSGYLGGIEPIFLGLAVSFVIYLLTRHE